MSKPLQITLTREGMSWWRIDNNRGEPVKMLTAGDTAALMVSDDVRVPGGSRAVITKHETVGVLVRADGLTIDVQTPETRARLEALKQDHLQRLERDRKRLSRRIWRLLYARLGFKFLRYYWRILWYGEPFDGYYDDPAYRDKRR